MKNKLKIRVAFLIIAAFLVSSAVTFEADASEYKTIFVLSQIDYVAELDGTVENFSYNSKGFVTKVEDPYFNQSWKYYYDSKCNIKKAYFASNSGTGFYSYFYYKKGKLSKQVQKKRFGDYDSTIKYSWKNGRISKIKNQYSSDSYSTSTFKYDKKGNVKYQKDVSVNEKKYVHASKISLKYKYGRLSKKSPKSGTVQKLSYKKITVPKKYVSKIKEQQWYFINHMLY